MNRNFQILFVLLSIALIIRCTTKESENFTDYETVEKNAEFRALITTGNFANLSNGYTYYELANAKSDTLIVMVHGFSVPSYIWDSTFLALKNKSYGALRYDTYGRGNSDNPDVPYNTDLYTQQLQELLDTLHISKQIYLMGLSDGGRTITAFAARYSERVKNLVYVDAVGFTPVNENDSLLLTVTDEEVLNFKKQDRYKTMATGQMSDFYDSIPFRGWDKQYQKLMQHKGFVRALISTNKNRTDLMEEHQKIADAKIPCFAIWGAQDQVVKLTEAKDGLNKWVPEQNLFVIDKAGHLPHMEQTTQFNQILINSIIRKN